MLNIFNNFNGIETKPIYNKYHQEVDLECVNKEDEELVMDVAKRLNAKIIQPYSNTEFADIEAMLNSPKQPEPIGRNKKSSKLNKRHVSADKQLKREEKNNKFF